MNEIICVLIEINEFEKERMNESLEMKDLRDSWITQLRKIFLFLCYCVFHFRC